MASGGLVDQTRPNKRGMYFNPVKRWRNVGFGPPGWPLRPVDIVGARYRIGICHGMSRRAVRRFDAQLAYAVTREAGETRAYFSHDD
jgi:hypothetical protein